MSYPFYYSKYLEYLKKAEKDDLTFFLSYLGGLEESDWRVLLFDLFAENSYPALIQRIGKDYSTIAYYAIYINKLPTEIRETIDRSINVVVDEAIKRERGENSTQILINALTLSRLLERGVASKLIIDCVLLSSSRRFPDSVKFEAAATLSHYKDVATLDFFKNTWQELKPNISLYQFLVFPRFIYISKIDLVEALSTLQHFSFQSYIKPEEIILPLEGFFETVRKQSENWDRIHSVFLKLDRELRKFILERVLESPVMHALKSCLEKPATHITIKAEELATDLTLANQRIFLKGVTINLEEVSNVRILNSIERRTNPYFSFADDETNAIDRNFIKKYRIFTFINNGRKHFKRSNFGKAMFWYDKALYRINSIPDPDNLTIYFYSWMLHEVGNVNFVLRRYEDAKQLYMNSYHVKNTIEEIPKAFMFATQLKILAAFLETSNFSEEYQTNIVALIQHLSRYRRESARTNHFFIDCLLGDANYYLTRAHFMTNDNDQFKFHFNRSLRYAKNNEDLTGLIELYTLYCIAMDSDDYLSEMEKTFGVMTSVQKQNPYLCSLLQSYDAPKNKKKGVWGRLTQIFDGHIKPIDVKAVTVTKSIP